MSADEMNTMTVPPIPEQSNGQSVAAVEDTRPRKRIGIVGYTASRAEAPYDNPEWELWGMNNLHQFVDPHKFARWYNLHPLDEIGKDAQHVTWLQQWQGCPVWLLDPHEGDPDVPSLADRTGWPQATALPTRHLRERFPDYYTNTVSWQLGHALYEAHLSEDYVLAEIGLWGIDMAVNSEYSAQRPSVELFIGIAMGLGVEITLPKGSDLIRTVSAYGFDDDAGFAPKMRQRLAECRERLVQLEGQQKQLDAEIYACKGAVDMASYVCGAWLPPAPGGGRDVVEARGALTGIGQMIAEADAAARHAPEEAIV